MTIQRFDVGPRMSQAVVHGDRVYLAGQVADDTSQDVAGQTRQVLAKIEALLEKAGSSKEQILTANVWLSDISDLQRDEQRVGPLGLQGEPALPRLRREPAGDAGLHGRDHDSGRPLAAYCGTRHEDRYRPSHVMAGLVPAIHDLFAQQRQRTWMPGTSPGMTARGSGGFGGLRRRET